jgi:SMI1/KNR4 family protein SUKH-1
MTPADKQRLLARFNGNPPADTSSMRQLETDASIRLPEDYARFLLEVDGGEGFVGDTYLILWRAGELLAMNEAYQVPEYAPGLFLFGSDGGGEAFAFDTRSDAKPIVSVPLVGMELKVVRLVASNFTAFLEELFKS